MNQPSLLIFNQTYVPRNFARPVNIRAFYQYNASGEKLRKIYLHKNPEGSGQEAVTTDYLNGFQYESKQVGSNTAAVILKFVPTSEGYYNFENNKYIYSYTDHLGNVRLSYFKNQNGSAEVLEENNFYPFGMKHEGYNHTAGNPSYNYQYGGKELQKETGWSDFGARMYMSDIARWGVIDPLAETTTRVNPYNYALNNPVMFIDPDGRKAFAPEPVEDNVPRGGLADFYLRGGNGSYASYNEFLGNDMLLFYKGANGAYGGGGSSATDPTPKTKTGPGIIQRIGNFLSRLFGGKKSTASGHNVKATVVDIAFIPEGVETTEAALTLEEAMATAGVLSRGLWAIPLILNGDSSHARGYDIPLTGATDVPAEPDPNLYLYRIMKTVNGMPMVGEGLDKLGLRDRDVDHLPNSTMITTFFENGLSVSVGFGNSIPSNVPDFTKGKGTLFKIPASSLISHGLIGIPVPKPEIPNYGQIRPAVPMNVGTFRALIQSTAPAWQPVK